MINNICVLIAVFVISSLSYGQVTVSFDEEMLLERIETLSSDTFEGRRTGEKGNAMAREYIIQEFQNLNAKTLGDTYEQPFSFTAKEKEYHGVNVLAAFEGTQYSTEYIVVSAHYDHLGIRNNTIYNGADDDASGVAALFSFAEYLSENPPLHSVILAAFDAEELGLQGARFFVGTMKESTIVANINMDMISRSASSELFVVGTRYNKILESIIQNFENPTSAELLIGHDGTDGKEDWT